MGCVGGGRDVGVCGVGVVIMVLMKGVEGSVKAPGVWTGSGEEVSG